MPKKYEDMKKEVYAKMQEFERAGDFKGLAQYWVSCYEKYDEELDADIKYGKEHGADTEQIELKSNLNHFKYATEEYFNEMGEDDARDKYVFDLRDRAIEEIVNIRIELGKNMDEVEREIKFGGLKGTELIADEPKLVSKIAGNLAFNVDNKLERKARGADELLKLVHGVASNYVLDKLRYRKLREEYELQSEQVFTDTWESHKELDDDTRKKYIKYASGTSSAFGETISGFTIVPYVSPDKAIIKLPKSIKTINECKSIEELEAFKEKLLKDKQIRVDFVNRNLEGSKKAKVFLEQLKSKKIDPPSDEYNELCEALEEFGKLGHGMKDLVYKNNKLIYHHKDIDNSLSLGTFKKSYMCIEERCRNFAEKHPEHGELSTTIKEFAAYGKKDAENEEKSIDSDSLFPGELSGTRIEQCDTLIKRIDVAEQRMFMNTEKPMQRYKPIKDFYNATDNVYNELMPLLDKITKDNEQREANKEGLSGTYIDFVDAAKKVKADYNFKKNTGGNINNAMAKKFAENLEELMNAANAYTKDHTGFTNMFKATHGVGEERLEWSKAFSEKISKALPDYRMTIDKMPKLGGATYGSEIRQIEIDMNNDRDAAKSKLKQIKELGTKINAAHDKVNETYTQQLKPEQECPEGVSKEEFFAQQKALVIDYAAKVLAVNLSGKQLKELQPNYKNMRDNEIDQLNTETLSEQGVANTAESIKKRDDWKQMTKNLTTWDDINRIKNLAAQKKGAGLVAELNRCERMLNFKPANVKNNAEQAKLQAKQELENKGFVIM